MADLEHIAIERLKTASEMSLRVYQQPLVVCISGGKDSSVITELSIRAGIPVEFMHNHTTADAPETVYFVRREFKRLEELGYGSYMIQCQICKTIFIQPHSDKPKSMLEIWDRRYEDGN